jgi:hypothetical protein
METTSTATTVATSRSSEERNLCLAKYITTLQQAIKKTFVEYEYRLCKFEKYIIASEEQQQKQNQDPRIAITSLDRVIDELKTFNKKIDPYDLLSGLVA